MLPGCVSRVRGMACAAIPPGHPFSSQASTDPALVVDQTLRWIEGFVVKLNLCPFAKRTIERGGLDVRVFSGSSAEALQDAVVGAAIQLGSGSNTPSTIVFAAPDVDGIANFERYLAVAGEVEGRLVRQHLDGKVQLATFHPAYRFADTSAEDITNYTNRSPWPLFHLLRETEVKEAIDSYGGNTDIIWRRNIATMRKLGRSGLKMYSVTKQDTEPGGIG